MKLSTFSKLMALAMASLLNSATAATLTIEFPGNSLNYTTSNGSYVDGLPDFGSFDFNIIYDSNKLSAASLDSASIFGVGTDTAYALQILGNYVPYTISTAGGVGDVHFAEAISGTSALTAGLSITTPTLLGTLHFSTLTTAANSLVNITSPVISDFNGNQLSGSIQAAYVTITPAAAVPLPAAAWLFAPLALLTLGNRKQIKQ